MNNTAIHQIPVENIYAEDVARHLTDVFGRPVRQISEFDEDREVYSIPENLTFQVIDLDETVILCDFDLWLDYEHVYDFNCRCVRYEKRHPARIIRKIMISPHVDEHSQNVATTLGVELYRQPEDIRRH